MFKICPSCGEKNPESAIICSSCMEDISSVTPQEEKEEPKAVVVFEGKEYEITSPCIIGRSEFLKEVLLYHKTISRKHLKIYFEKGSWFVEDLNSTNGTYLNGERLKMRQKLQNQDIIGLGKSFEITFLINASSKIKKTSN